MNRIFATVVAALFLIAYPSFLTAVPADADNFRRDEATLDPRVVELHATSRGDVSLAGSLYLPAGPGPFSAVVFTHGSEPGRRTSQGYIRWAKLIQDRGIAALIFDKRGVGDSQGEYVEAPDLQVPADDLLAWVKLLKTRKDLDPKHIGVIGWSQGGWVGPLAASQSRDLAFVVTISGPGVSPLKQNIYDKTNRFRATGAAPERVEQFSKTIEFVWTYLVTGKNREEAAAAWDAVKNESWFRRGYDGPPMMDRDKVLASSRMQSYVAHSGYDPVPILEKVRVPMPAVFGGADKIVPVEESIEAMRGAFARGENSAFEYKIYPGANHGIAVRGPDGSRSLAPGYLDFVANWVVKKSRTSR